MLVQVFIQLKKVSWHISFNPTFILSFSVHASFIICNAVHFSTLLHYIVLASLARKIETDPTSLYHASPELSSQWLSHKTVFGIFEMFKMRNFNYVFGFSCFSLTSDAMGVKILKRQSPKNRNQKLSNLPWFFLSMVLTKTFERIFEENFEILSLCGF